MGNCCGTESGASESGGSLLPRPARFPGQGRTLESTYPKTTTTNANSEPTTTIGDSDAPPPASPRVEDSEAARRRELMRQAAENRNAPQGSGKLAQNLAKQKAGGMEGARKEAAAEAVRRREVDQQEEARRGG